MNEWISVDEGRHPVSVPMDQKYVLVYAPDDDWGPGGNVHFAVFYEHTGWRLYGSNSPRHVTHWKPVPGAPR